MKRKFYFHRQNAPLDTDHVIYVLWVGESVREQRMLTQLIAWSFNHGATLRSWGEDVDLYLLLEAERVFPGKGLLDFGFVRTEVSARELLTLMETNGWLKYESELSTPKAFFTQLSAADPFKIAEVNLSKKSHCVLSSKRKNLSQTDSTRPTIIRFV